MFKFSTGILSQREFMQDVLSKTIGQHVAAMLGTQLGSRQRID